MAQFEGTISEFTKYIGAYCRIKVMHVTTKYRKNLGSCEECGSTKQLEAAHIRGKERPLIISNILSQYIDKDIIKVDLKEFEERFVEAHLPVKETIRILCRECHKKYDDAKSIHEFIPAPGNIGDENETEKLDITETTTIERLVNETLNKSKAIDIINAGSKRKLSNANTLFSNINSAIDVWWLEPHNERFKVGFDFILNYPDERALLHFHLPPYSINDPKLLFYQRNDSDYSKIYIPKSKVKFVDKKGFDFGKFFIGIVGY